MSKLGVLLERLATAVAEHARRWPDHEVLGIGMAWFDMDRLGISEGEELLPGLPVTADGKTSGNFRIICDGQHASADEARALAHA